VPTAHRFEPFCFFPVGRVVPLERAQQLGCGLRRAGAPEEHREVPQGRELMRVVGQFGPVVDDFGELRQRAGHVPRPSLERARRYECDALGEAAVDRARQPDRLLVVSEGGVRRPIAGELAVRVRDPGSTGRTRSESRAGRSAMASGPIAWPP